VATLGSTLGSSVFKKKVLVGDVVASVDAPRDTLRLAGFGTLGSSQWRVGVSVLGPGLLGTGLLGRRLLGRRLLDRRLLGVTPGTIVYRVRLANLVEICQYYN
jgi:hypothetical protein